MTDDVHSCLLSPTDDTHGYLHTISSKPKPKLKTKNKKAYCRAWGP